MQCPHCGMNINHGVTKCMHCTGDITYSNALDGTSIGTKLISFFAMVAIVYYIAQKWLEPKTSLIIAFGFSVFAMIYQNPKRS